MHVTVKFFSYYREMAGTDRLTVDVAEDATVGQLVHVLSEELQSPTLSQEPVILMVNHRHALPETRLEDGDEILFLPLLSGG
jgi:molybdopterin converting factor small subunit